MRELFLVEREREILYKSQQKQRKVFYHLKSMEVILKRISQRKKVNLAIIIFLKVFMRNFHMALALFICITRRLTFIQGSIV